MIDDIRAAREAALAQVAAAADLDAIMVLGASLLGKRGDLAQLKTKLGALATVDEKRAAGQAVNEAMGVVDECDRGPPGRARRRRADGSRRSPSGST